MTPQAPLWSPHGQRNSLSKCSILCTGGRLGVVPAASHMSLFVVTATRLSHPLPRLTPAFLLLGQDKLAGTLPGSLTKFAGHPALSAPAVPLFLPSAVHVPLFQSHLGRPWSATVVAPHGRCRRLIIHLPMAHVQARTVGMWLGGSAGNKGASGGAHACIK